MESVWRALSSPHRRQILDLLKAGPMTTGQVAKQLPGMSRFAVMQHLDVLEESRLVISKKEGRARLNFSNPALIREELGRWMDDRSIAAAETTLHLRRYAESQQRLNTMNESFRVVKIEMEMVLKATPEIVYNAIVHEMDKWWPHRFVPGSSIRVDPRPGGLMEEVFEGGGGAVYGQIMMLIPGRKVVTSSPSALNTTFYSNNVETFEPHADGSLYKKSMTLFGHVPEEMERMYTEGSRQLMEDALRGYVEGGKA